ncbi:MAG: MATE family efflux transporter [Clostridia bacterium]|nr:MATE family efflux transporter [Clostridia bacterium]
MKISSAERAQMMLHAPVSRIIPQLAVPTIISMLITSIYNMADTYFVSQISTSASGAVGVVFSVMGIIQALSFTIGMGSGAPLSQALGSGKTDEARTLANVGFFTALMLGAAILVLGNVFLDPIVGFLGATETIAPHAKAYASYIFYAAPFMMCSFVMNNHLRFQGLATYGMVGITTGGILNMFLDPLFIFEGGTELFGFLTLPFGFGLGTAGAAIATAISQFVSFTILLLQCNLRRDTISIHPRHFRPTAKLYGKILYIGFPSLGRQGIASVSNILLNNTVKACVAAALQDPAISAISIVSRFVMFINSSVIGFGQGFQPVCGFNYGAGQYSRVRKAFWFSVKVTTVILLVLGLIAFIFAAPIITAFRAEDAEVIRIGTVALRLHLSTIPLWGFIVMSNMYTQSIGYGGRATLLSASRQGIFLIPALLILPRILPLSEANMPFAVAAAQPLADVLSFVMAIFITASILKQFREKADAPLKS